MSHHFQMQKRLKWPVCCKCGLVQLRNARTERAVRAPCPGLLDT